MYPNNPTKKINAPSIVLKIRLLNIVFNKLIKFLILFKFLLDIKNSVFIFYMVVYLLVSNLRKQNIQESYFLDTLLDVIYSQKLQEVIIYKGNISLAHKNIIIATANSNTQMNGVVKKITDVLQDKTSINVEGKDSTWLLIEVKEVLIHIFNKDSREFYNLEDIYFDCELIYQYG